MLAARSDPLATPALEAGTHAMRQAQESSEGDARPFLLFKTIDQLHPQVLVQPVSLALTQTQIPVIILNNLDEDYHVPAGTCLGRIFIVRPAHIAQGGIAVGYALHCRGPLGSCTDPFDRHRARRHLCRPEC